MKKYLFILFILCTSYSLVAQTFNGSGGAIAGSSTTQTCYNATVSGVGIINTTRGLAQVCMNITHPNTDELEIVLTAPDGTIVPLTVQNGGSGNNYTNTCFSATATTSIKFGTSPFTGSFLPEGYLGAVNNGQNANGVWRLCIQDRRTTANAGTLNNWSLTFSTTPAPPPPAFPACANTLPAGSSCAGATPVCDFNGLCGNTALNSVQDWTGSGLNTCFGLQNNSFVKFIASAPTVSFSIWVPTSTGSFENGGIQMLFFSGTCNSGPVTSHGCYPHIFGYSSPGIPLVTVVSATGLTVGNTYYLMIDGFNNANCTFRIAANTGINILNISPTNPTICNGQSVNLTASGANGIYAWSPSVNLSATSGTTVTVNPTSNQTYTVTSSSVGGCPITKDVTVTVTPVVTPTTGFSYVPNTVCANANNPTVTTVTGFTTGGTYSASPAGLSINATTGAIDVAASSPGNYTITYAVAATGCNPAASNTTTFSITAAVTPTTGFSYAPNTVCANASNPTLTTVTGFTGGGTYSATPAGLSINATTGAIDVATSSPGNYTITYSVAANGCNPAGTNTTTFSITAAVTPTTGFSYAPNTVCANASNPTLSTVIGFTTGGTYSASPAGLSINATTGAINVAASSPGNYTITYSVAANGCNPAATNTATFSITATVTPTTGFSYAPNTVCANASNPTLTTVTGFTGGGTYSASPAGLSINATTGAIDVATSSPGNYTITYSVAANGCNPAGTNTATFSITAAVTPTTGFSYAPNTVCANASNPTLTTVAGFTGSGTYSATPAGLAINATAGAIDVAASSPGNYTITYSVAANGCNPAGTNTATFSITAAVTPTIGFSYTPNTVCASASNPTLSTVTGFTAGGTYSASPAGLSINATNGAIDVATSSPGNYTITYSVAATGCNPAGTYTATFSITAAVTPITGFSYAPNTVCANASNPTLSTVTGFTTGGTYSSTPAGLSINATTGAINVAASSPGNYTITYSVVANGCNPAASNTATFSITAAVTPITGFSYAPNTVCATANNPTLSTVTGFTIGGTYSATPTGLSINATTGAINVAASSPGNYTITYAVAATGCNPAASNTTTFTIGTNISPVVNFFYQSDDVCVNSPNPPVIYGTGFTTGGVFTASPAGLSINPSTGAVNLAASSAGSYTVTYTIVANGCILAGSSTSPLKVTANTTQTTNFSYSPNNVCNNAANPIINTGSTFTTGGTYTAIPTGLSINSTTGAINVAASAPGNYTITYSVAANGCVVAGSSTTTFTITAVNPVVTGFNYSTNSVCVNGANPSIITSTGFTSGGVFSASPAGLNINPTTGAINVAASAAGNYTITYSIAAAGCNAAGNSTATFLIANAITPTTGFSYSPNSICSTGLNPTLNTVTGFTTGGTFTATPAGLSINASTGAVNIATSNTGTYTITYAIAANACIAAASSTNILTISNSITPTTSFTYSADTLCINAADPTLITSPGFTIGGTFSSSPAGLSVNATTGAISIGASVVGDYTITYTLPANGCTLAGNSSTKLVLKGVGVSNTFIAYTPDSVCANGSDPTLFTTVGFTTGGVFSAVPAGLSINSSTGAINVAASSIGRYTITYAVTVNGCANAGLSRTRFIIGNSNTAITNFTYSPNNICSNGGNPTITTASGFATGGTFSATPAGLNINATTGAINTATSSPGTYTVTYTLPANGCNGTVTSNTTFTINPSSTPNTSFSYSPNTICNNANNPVLNKTLGFTNGGIFSATPIGLSLNSTTGDINVAASQPGNYIVTYSIAANGCTAATNGTTTITINAVTTPVTAFSYNASFFCDRAANPIITKAAGFTPTGIFSASPAGLAINANTGAINLATSAPNNYIITYQVNATACNPAGSSTSNITISSTLPRVTGFSYSADTICTNSTTLSLNKVAGFTNGGIFTSTPIGLNINSTSGIINLATSLAGSYTIDYTIAADACNTLATNSTKLVVQTAPITPIISAPPTNLCGPNKVSIFAASTGTINWYDDITATTIIGTGNRFDTFLQSTTTLYAIATNANCTSNANAVTIQLFPLPTKPFLGNDTAICATDQLILNAGNYDNYLWQDGSTNATFTANTTGLYSVTISNSGNCSSADTIAVNILSNCDDIYFANSFSPNGDGINENFGPLGNVFLLSKYQLRIYNRYGQLIFNTNNPYQKWDGKKEVQRNGSASYVWYCTYTYKNAQKIKKGNVLVVK